MEARAVHLRLHRYESTRVTFEGYKETSYFECAGTASEFLLGACETFYKDDMEPEELFEVVSQCLLSAMDRDSLSGWGATVYILTPTELIVRNIKTRQD